MPSDVIVPPSLLPRNMGMCSAGPLSGLLKLKLSFPLDHVDERSTVTVLYIPHDDPT